MPTDVEANKYSFLDFLEHYMEQALISESNCKAVELVIMVEVGTNVREMDPMKKALKEKAFLNSYVSVIWEIPTNYFENEAICPAMLLAYKGARKKMVNGYSVLLAVCSAICPASFGHVLPFCMEQNILANE
jgi:hypothetical protein